MAENGNLNNNNNNSNNFNNFNSTTTESAREFINRYTTTTTTAITCINSTITTSLPGTLEETTNINEQTGGICENDATHYRLRGGVIEGFEYITCLSCGERFKSTSISEVYDHYKEQPHLRHYSNCLYCHGKVHQYYHNSLQLVKYYHNCLRWKRGEDN